PEMKTRRPKIENVMLVTMPKAVNVTPAATTAGQIDDIDLNSAGGVDGSSVRIAPVAEPAVRRSLSSEDRSSSDGVGDGASFMVVLLVPLLSASTDQNRPQR